MKRVLEKGRVTAGQDVLVKLTNCLKMAGTPPLGPQFSELSGTDLNDALIIHRMIAKFEKPNGEATSKREVSINKMLAYDAAYESKKQKLFDGEINAVPLFLEARAYIHKILKGYRMSYDVQFPKGESVISSRGYVDFYYKLANQDQWTVSSSCVRRAATIAYNNRALKRLVMQRFRSKYWPGGVDPRIAWVREARELNKFIGFYVFERVFLFVVDIVGVSRLTTVPKNNKEDRVITCDPVWNLVVQRSIALGILSKVHSNTGIDITQLQDIHRAGIADRTKATVDMSKASDSNWLGIFKMLFPKRIVEDVLAARTGIAEFEGLYYILNQVAPMGCGFTFELMSVTLMAYARVFDPKATVFGDDVLMDAKHAKKFMSFVSSVGWVINEEKSFVDGNFSESCGGFYNHSQKAHIVSFDLTFPENIGDVIAATNKISSILLARQTSVHIRNLFLEAYISLLKILPCVAFTEEKLLDGEEASMVWVPKGLNAVESFNRKGEADYSCDLQRGISYGKRLVYQADVEIKPRRDDVDLLTYVCYMRNGVRAIGPKTGEFKWLTYLRNS